MAHRRFIFGLYLCLLCTVGCASLPDIAPGAAPPSTVPVSLEGARGPLSPAQSKAILDRLKSSGADTNIFDRHLALEEAMTGSPLNAGNKVQLLLDGPATYDAMLSAIAGAQDHVNMETYIMDDDDIGRNFAKVLVDKQMQGVQINLIRDSVGTFGTPSEFFQALVDKGIKVIEFNPINPLVAGKDWSPNRRDHRKLLIVDGKKAFLGGINISSVYSGGSFGKGARNRKDGALAWRDTDLQLEGPVVAELQKLFLATWEKQKGGPLPEKNYFPPAKSAGQTVVRAIGSTPNEPYSQIYAALLSAIGNAETSVYLTNAYFAPDPQLLAALTAAVARGVDVKLILPSQTDSWLVFHAGRGYYTRLLKAGIKIFQLRGAILHSKTALIDGVWATVGSTNLDWRSFLHNQELDAVVLGAEFGGQVQAMFARDLAASDEVLLAQWQRRTLDLRLKELFARIWEYWL
jgi:cardiolipin synthase A/B